VAVNQWHKNIIGGVGCWRQSPALAVWRIGSDRFSGDWPTSAAISTNAATAEKCTVPPASRAGAAGIRIEKQSESFRTSYCPLSSLLKKKVKKETHSREPRLPRRRLSIKSNARRCPLTVQQLFSIHTPSHTPTHHSRSPNHRPFRTSHLRRVVRHLYHHDVPPRRAAQPPRAREEEVDE
jgi:hypothetical protein